MPGGQLEYTELWLVLIRVFNHVNFKFMEKFFPWRITLSFNFYQTPQRDEHSFSFEFLPFFLSYRFFFVRQKAGLGIT